MKTYNEIYLTARNILKSRGIENPGQEARILVSAAAGKTIQQLMRDLNLYTTNDVDSTAGEFVSRRLRGEPLAYITGSWEFYGLPMIVTSDVLIPRIDTEVLVETAKELLLGKKMNARILDLCSGSGCITCGIGSILSAAKFMDIDISASALEVCKKNLLLNHLENRAICMQADALTRPPMGIGTFDMIVSNPPYIPSSEILTLDSSVRDYEPIWALDGGEDGLKFYRSIAKNWKSQLAEDGALLLEVGENQADPVSQLLLDAGFASVEYRKDSAGTDRVVVGLLSV